MPESAIPTSGSSSAETVDRYANTVKIVAKIAKEFIEQGQAVIENLEPGTKIIFGLISSYCIKDLGDKLNILLDAEIRRAKMYAIDAKIAFENKRFDEVKSLWKQSYDCALGGMAQSTTSELAVHSVNFVLAAKMDYETFDRDRETYVEFHLLDDNVQKSIAETIQHRIDDFQTILERTDTGLGALFRPVSQLFDNDDGGIKLKIKFSKSKIKLVTSLA